MTRETFETALDTGQLEILGMTKWYRCRRNGRTRTWKRDPARFEIPIKFRFRDTLLITSREFYNGEVTRWFRVAQ